jgi:predicted ATPase/class 3 adenylate cyclase
MFDLGARDHPPEQVYREYLQQSDVFVGIYWQSYGWPAPGADVSGLEEEVRLAFDKPRLIYIKEPSPNRDPRLKDLIEWIWQSGVATNQISGPEDLAERLTQDMALMLSERFDRTTKNLPTGTVTFVFADVQGSTQMLERFGPAFSDLLGRFRRESEALINQMEGVLVKSEGDGLFAVFPTADLALRAAIEAQRTYLSYPPPGPLSVRIGLHSGQGVVVDGDYVGLDVHRAARVGAAANGGQIVISASTRELIRAKDEASLVDLGWYELKGLSRPDHLYHVAVAGLPAEFPPLQARQSDRSRLPRQLTSIVGRETDIAAVVAMLGKGVRILTLTGPGGIGKSRLAIAVAAEAEALFRDEIAFIGLASVTEPDRVPEAIAAGLGRSIEGSSSAEEVIADELRDKKFLLILDNFEQIVDCAPLLRRLLERLPLLQILVTSRISLQLSAEQEYPVSPLGLPASNAEAATVAMSPAIQLLLTRARAVRPDISVTADNAQPLAEIVGRLDGIPLAIELAAARLRLLEPRDLLKRLSSALDLAGAVDLPPRQRTLRAAIDWSHQILAQPEQVLLRRLGVFVDGWTLDSAEAITGGNDVGDVGAALDTLATHSLIRLETVPDDGVRMRLLGPIQDYARERLSESGEIAAIEGRHARYFGQTVENYPRGSGEGLAAWERRMSLEWGNIRRAILWCVEASEFETLARMLNALWPMLWQHDRTEETRGWLDALRPHLADLPPDVRAQALYVDGFFAQEVGDYEHAVQRGLETLAAAKAIGNEELGGQARLLVSGSLPALDIEDPRILTSINEAVAIFRRRGDTVNLAYALNFLGSYQATRGELEDARIAIEEALALAEDVEALPIKAQSSAALAFIYLLSGHLDEAERKLSFAVNSLELTPNREIMSYVLDGYGWWALIQGREIAGLTAIGAAEGIRSRVGLRTWPLTTAQIAMLARLADSYEDPDSQAARRAGRDLTAEAALAVVTDNLDPRAVLTP